MIYREFGAVSLHLYTPPFGSCKVWMDEKTSLSDYEIGKVCAYIYST